MNDPSPAAPGPGSGAPDATPPGEAASPRVPRAVKGVLYVLGGLLGLVLLAVAGLLVVLQTPWGADQAKQVAVRRLNALFDGAELQVERLGGNFVGRLALYNVTLVKTDGERLAHVDTLTARYRLLPLLQNRLHLTDIYLASPYVRMEQGADGAWDLLNVIARDSTDVDTVASAQTTLVIELDHFDLRRGTVEAAFYAGGRDSVLVARDLGIELGDMVFGEDLSLRLDTLFTRIALPGEDGLPLELALGGALDSNRFQLGGLRLESPRSHVAGHGLLALPSEANDNGRDLDFTLTAQPLAFADIAPFVPALAPEGSVEMTLRVKGAPNRIDAEADATFSDGATIRFTGVMTPPGQAPARYQAEGEVRGLNPAFLTGDPAQEGLVNADLDVDLQGPRPEQVDGRAHLVVSDARYGAYTLDRTTLTSTFTDGLARFDLSTGLRGAALTAGGTARPFDDVPRYDVEGRLNHFDLGRFSEGGTQHSDVSARFEVRGQGVDAQTADLTAAVVLAPSRVNAYRLHEGRLDARLQNGTLGFDTRVRLPQGLVAAEGDATFGDEVRYRVRRGRVQNLDVAALSGDTTRSALNATFSLEGRGTAPEAMRLQADVRVQPSYYGPYRLRDGRLHAVLRDERLDLTAGADLGAAGSVFVQANGRPFAPVPSFEVPSARFRNLDVGVLAQNPAQQTDLNGTVALRLRGTAPQTMALAADLRLTASRVNEQVIESMRLQAGRQRGTLTFDTRLDLPAGQTTLVGRARPFDAVPTYAVTEGRFSGLDAGTLSGNPDLHTDLNGSLTLEGRGLEPETMTLDAVLRFDPSTINRDTLRSGEVEAHTSAGAARVNAALDFTAAAVRLDARGRFDTDVPTYEAHGTVSQLDLARLTGADTLDARLTMGFDVEGAGTDPQTMTLAGQVHARESAYRTFRLDTLGTRFRLADGVLAVDSLLLRANVAEARAGGTIALFDTTGRHTSDFRLAADVTTLEPVRPLIQADVFSLREGHLEAAVRGPSDALQVEATAELNSLVYNTMRLAGLQTRVSGTLGPDRLPQAGEVETTLNYFATPTLTVRQTRFGAQYDGDEVAFSAETAVDDERDAQLAGRVDLRPEQRQVQLETLGLRLGPDRWALAQPATIAFGDAYRVQHFSLSSGEQRIVVDGVVDPGGTQDFHVLVERLRVGGFADLAGYDQLGGTLDTRLDLTGPAAEPLLDGDVSLALQYEDRPAGDLRLALAYAAQRLNLDARLTHRQGSALTLAGYVPLDLALAPTDTTAAAVEAAGGAVDLRVTADTFALDWARPFLDPEQVREIAGYLSTDVRITGRMDAPDLAGTMRLAQGRLDLPPLGVVYDDITVEAALAGGTVTLQNASLTSGDGTLTAEGRIAVPELTLGTFDIRTRLDDFRAIDSDLYGATVSGDLTLRGTTDAPVVAGDLQVLSADLYLTTTGGGDIRQVGLTDEDVRMLEEFFGYRVSRRDTTVSAIYEATALDLTVEIERDTWVRQTANPEIAVQMTGTVDLQKQPNGELQLFRGIEVVPARSYVRQFGRRFDIARGNVTFNGPLTEMMMDVGARYEVPSRDHPDEPEAVITLSVTGRLDDLRFSLGSEPTMGNTDIVSYIATGRPASEALQFGGGGGSGGGLLTAGGALAANQLAGVVENIAGEQLGLDVIEIQQDGLRGTQLVAGKYVSPRLYVGINQPISFTSTDQSGGARATEVTMEYEMVQWALLQILSGTSTSSVRLNLTGRYAFDW